VRLIATALLLLLPIAVAAQVNMFKQTIAHRAQGAALIDALRNVSTHGLPAARYDVAGLMRRRNKNWPAWMSN